MIVKLFIFYNYIFLKKSININQIVNEFIYITYIYNWLITMVIIIYNYKVGPSFTIAELVNIPPISLWFMIRK